MYMRRIFNLSVAAAAISLIGCSGGARNDADLSVSHPPISVDFDKTSQFSPADFKNPPMQFRIVPFWSWNEVMEPAEIRRQLKLMKQGGWGGSMVHSRTGLLTDYLGEDWFKAVDACIDESAKLGMYVWLYDEDKWPSGYAGGDVLAANVDFAAKSLCARPVGTAMPSAAKPVGAPVGGIQVFEYRAPQCNAWFNGTSYVDTMSKQAMDEFKKRSYTSYFERYKPFCGNVVVAEFTDEPAQVSRYASDVLGNSVGFSSDLVAQFKADYGFDPVPHFYKLFTNGEGAMKFRLQYYRTANRLFERNFMKNIGDECRANGIALTGHCMAEAGSYSQQLWSGRIMPYYRHMGIPGIDHLARNVDMAIIGKQCQSVCNQYGKARMLSELYGVSGGSLSFEDRYWIGTYQLVLGVNQFVPHLSLFSMAGCRKRDFPQNINVQQSWWKMNAAVDIPLARACYAMAQGKYAADILVLSPQESAAAAWIAEPKDAGVRDSSAQTRKDCAKIGGGVDAVINALFASQLTFDLGDEQLLQEDGFVRGGKIGIAQMSYRVVVVPTMITMRPSTLAKLKEFSANGGTVILSGEAPQFLDGEKSAALDEFFAKVKRVSAADLPAAVNNAVAPMIALETKSGVAGKLWAHIRNLNDGSRLIMLANLDRFEKYSGILCADGAWTRAQLLNTENGEIADLSADVSGGKLRLPISVEESQAVILRLSNEKPQKAADAFCKVLAAEKISGWNVERLDDNSLTLDYASFSFDNGRDGLDVEVPVLEIMNALNDLKYDGNARVFYKFNAENLDALRKLHLVVEYADRLEIKLNGKPIKYAGLPFWRDFRWLPIDITGLVKRGENVVEVFYKNFKYGDLATYKPQWRRYGTEIENIYLVGDFSVRSVDTGARSKSKRFASYNAKMPKNVSISKDALSLTNPAPLSFGDATVGGLPFYAGRVLYSATLKTPKREGERLFVRLGNLDCPVAEVRVDGKSAGAIKFAPYELDITDFVKNPESKVEIVFYASLRNLMDCPHNPAGEMISIWPVDYTIRDMPKSGKRLQWLKKFADGTWKSNHWVRDYCQVEFANPEKIELVRKARGR